MMCLGMNTNITSLNPLVQEAFHHGAAVIVPVKRLGVKNNHSKITLLSLDIWRVRGGVGGGQGVFQPHRPPSIFKQLPTLLTGFPKIR